MRASLITAVIALLVVFSMSSCRTYIDATNGSTPVEQGSLKFYTDNNLFTFKTSIILTRDKEEVHPKFFQVTLPKKIRYYEFINSTDFGFYYDKGQVVFIKIELEPVSKRSDTIYTPLKGQLEEFLQADLKTGGGKYDIKKIPFYKDRKNAIITKGDATIILYNITDNNYDQFLKYLNRFEFIK